jgi:hypothetical protein
MIKGKAFQRPDCYYSPQVRSGSLLRVCLADHTRNLIGAQLVLFRATSEDNTAEMCSLYHHLLHNMRNMQQAIILGSLGVLHSETGRVGSQSQD